MLMMERDLTWMKSAVAQRAVVRNCRVVLDK